MAHPGVDRGPDGGLPASTGEVTQVEDAWRQHLQDDDGDEAAHEQGTDDGDDHAPIMRRGGDRNPGWVGAIPARTGITALTRVGRAPARVGLRRPMLAVDQYDLVLAVLGLALLGAAVVPRLLAERPLSLPIVYLGPRASPSSPCPWACPIRTPSPTERRPNV